MDKSCPTPTNPGQLSDCQLLENYRARAQQRLQQKRATHDPVVLEKAAGVELLLLDVDGVLTDGTLIYAENGVEAKTFHTRDGFGLRLVREAGIEVGIITARTSSLVRKRAEELGFRHIHQGVGKKLDAWRTILETTAHKPYQVCYMGDDWLDLPLLCRAGLAACPADGVEEVRNACHFVTAAPGGHGAVREVCNLLVESRGLSDRLLQNYLSR